MTPSETPGPFVSITARDLWNKLDNMEKGLHSLEKVVNTAVTRMESLTQKTDDNAARIKALEVKLYGLIAGLVAGLVALIAGVFR